MPRSVSVRDILDDNLTIHAHEAVTLVQQVCRYLAWKSSLGEPVGVPPLNEIRIDAAGEAVITELKPADAPPAVPELAQLLASLLPTPGRDQRRLVPAALRFTLARALGDVDVRPFASVAEFCAAIARFERDTPRQTIGALFDRWRTSRREDVAARVFVEGDWVVDEEGFRERQPGGDVPLAGRIVALVGVERRKRAPARMPEPSPPDSNALVPIARLARAKLQRRTRGLAVAAALLAAASIPVGWRVMHPAPPPVAQSGALSPAIVAWQAPPAPRVATISSSPVRGSAVFVQPGAGGDAAVLRVASADGAMLRVTSLVDDGAKSEHVSVSPDGAAIAFDSDRDGERGVYVAAADGRDVRRVSGGGFAAMPAWSPDGTRLAFVRAEAANSKVWNVWTYDLESGEMRRATHYTAGRTAGVSWFPGGRRIGYSHGDGVYVLDLATAEARRYGSPLPGRLTRLPAVSPDGRRIAFQVARDGVWLVDLHDGSMRRVVADPAAEAFTWAPDSRRLAFRSAREGWRLWTVPRT